MGKPHLVEIMHREGVRGSESSGLFWAESTTMSSETQPSVGHYFDTAEALRNSEEIGILAGHDETITRIVDHYETRYHTN